MSSLNNLRMYPFKIYVSFAFLGVFLACGDTDPSKGFGILLEEGGKKFQINQQIGIGLKNTSGMEVDSVRYSLEGIPLVQHNGEIFGEVLFPAGQKHSQDTESGRNLDAV